MFPMPAAPKEVHDYLVFRLDIRSLWSEIFGIGRGQHFDVVFESLQVLYVESDMIKPGRLCSVPR